MNNQDQQNSKTNIDSNDLQKNTQHSEFKSGSEISDEIRQIFSKLTNEIHEQDSLKTKSFDRPISEVPLKVRYQSFDQDEILNNSTPDSTFTGIIKDVQPDLKKPKSLLEKIEILNYLYTNKLISKEKFTAAKVILITKF